MAVILANCSLTLRRRVHQWLRDDHGTPVAPAVPQVTVGPQPGFAKEQVAQQRWVLRADPSFWPVEPGDDLVDATNKKWTVVTAELHTVPGYPTVDYVGVIATLDPPEVP